MALKIVGVIIALGMVLPIFLAGLLPLDGNQKGILLGGAAMLIIPALVVWTMIYCDED